MKRVLYISRFCLYLLCFLLFSACKQDFKTNQSGFLYNDLPLVEQKFTFVRNTVVKYPWQKLKVLDLSEQNEEFYFDEYSVSQAKIENFLGKVKIVYRLKNSPYHLEQFVRNYDKASVLRFFSQIIRHNLLKNITMPNYFRALKCNIKKDLRSFFPELNILRVIIERNLFESGDQDSLKELKAQIGSLEKQKSNIVVSHKDQLKLQKLKADYELELVKQQVSKKKSEADNYYQTKILEAENIRQIGKIQNKALRLLIQTYQKK